MIKKMTTCSSSSNSFSTSEASVSCGNKSINMVEAEGIGCCPTEIEADLSVRLANQGLPWLVMWADERSASVA